MTMLNSRLQLALLNRKKARNLLEKGFTLVELMIVIVIVGVLSAVALPNFLGTKEKATAGATIGSTVGLAKQCSLNAISENTDALPTGSNVTLTALNSGTNCSKGATLVNTNAFVKERIAGMECTSEPTTTSDVVVANGTSHTKCTITVDQYGAITGAWS